MNRATSVFTPGFSDPYILLGKQHNVMALVKVLIASRRTLRLPEIMSLIRWYLHL